MSSSRLGTAVSTFAPTTLAWQGRGDRRTVARAGYAGRSASRCRTSSSARRCAVSARPVPPNLLGGAPWCRGYNLLTSRRRSGPQNGTRDLHLVLHRCLRRLSQRRNPVGTSLGTTIHRCTAEQAARQRIDLRQRVSKCEVRRVQRTPVPRLQYATVVATSLRRRTVACDFRRSANTSCFCGSSAPLRTAS